MGSKTGQERRKVVLGLLGNDKMKEEGSLSGDIPPFFVCLLLLILRKDMLYHRASLKACLHVLCLFEQNVPLLWGKIKSLG